MNASHAVTGTGKRSTASAPGTTVHVSATYPLVLWLLLSLFSLRVLGQILVVFCHVRFLPPAKQWESGLLPYRLLLPAQLLILALLGKVSVDFTRANGPSVVTRPRLGRALRRLSYLYFSSMVLRYGIRMAVRPQERWLGGCIPIVFHCVLATFLFTWGHYHSRRIRTVQESRN
jgi:hypothetical protein